MSRSAAQGMRRHFAVRAAILALLALAYLAVALAPVLLAWAQGLPRRPFVDDFSSAMALAAFAMLLAEFYLSGRFRAVSAGAGIDLVMRMHQLLARTALVLVALHPFLYSLPFTAGGTGAPSRMHAVLLTPAATVSGMLALLLLGALVVFAMFRDQLGWRYETWRLTHGLGAAALAAFGFHHALDIGRYSAHAWLAGFWGGALVLALLALAHIYFVKPLLMARRSRRHRVAALRKVALKTWRLELEPESGDGAWYEPGQFAWLRFGRPFLNLLEFPFSLASAPAADGSKAVFLIKEVGDFTGAIGNLAVGAPVYVDGPHGNFTLRRRSGAGIALIAGGIGVAPISGLLRHLVATRDPRPVSLIFGNRVAEQVLPLDEGLAGGLPGSVRVHHVLSEPPPGWRGLRGMLDANTLERLLPVEGRADWLYFVCGPPEMIDAVENALEQLGVPLGQIVAEKFRYTARGATRRDRLMLGAYIAISVAIVGVAAAFALRG